MIIIVVQIGHLEAAKRTFPTILPEILKVHWSILEVLFTACAMETIQIRYQKIKAIKLARVPGH